MKSRANHNFYNPKRNCIYYLLRTHIRIHPLHNAGNSVKSNNLNPRQLYISCPDRYIESPRRMENV